MRIYRDAAFPVDDRMWAWIEGGIPSPVRIKWLRQHWRRALNAAGLNPDFRLYDLRHLPAQGATDSGISETRVSKFMRHGADMTHRYAAQRDKTLVAKTIAHRVLGVA